LIGSRPAKPAKEQSGKGDVKDGVGLPLRRAPGQLDPADEDDKVTIHDLFFSRCDNINRRVMTDRQGPAALKRLRLLELFAQTMGARFCMKPQVKRMVN
jgi:hypothetical protein